MTLATYFETFSWGACPQTKLPAVCLRAHWNGLTTLKMLPYAMRKVGITRKGDYEERDNENGGGGGHGEREARGTWRSDV